MKKTMLLGTALSAAAVLGLANFASAAGTPPNIYFSTRAQGTEDEMICYLYGGGDGATVCDATYGSYDSTHGVLTLKAGISGKPNGRVGVENIDGITITADSDIETNLRVYGGSEVDLTLDFGNYTFTDALYKYSDAAEGVYSGFGGDALVIKSGVFNNMQLFTDSLDIQGGTINIRPGLTMGVAGSEFIKISGGEINIPGASMAFSSGGDISITGGKINATDIEDVGFDVGGDLKITGGKVNLKSAATPAGFGVGLFGDKSFTIDDGELTIDGFKWGINGANSKIYFNGGVTTIKNSTTHTIWIDPAADPEHDIVFGEGMGIKEDTYVFWDDEKGTGKSVGIAESGTVTIAKGYPVRWHYGWEDVDEEDGDDDVKAPDTGRLSIENGGAMMAMVSLGVLAMIANGAYVAAYVAKRKQVKVKFNK